jgi:acetyl esterase/lipase
MTVVKGIEYAPADPSGNEGHLLDLYLPESARPTPLVIWSKGSGWLFENGRDGADVVARHLNPAGFAVAGVAIRSSQATRFPGQLHDIKSAVRWLRAHARQYNVDSEHVGIMGESSGGWAAAMAGVTGEVPSLEGNVGVAGPSSAVQATLAFYPPTDFLRMDTHMPVGGGPFNQVFGLTEGHSDPRSPESLLLGAPIRECPQRVAEANPITYANAASPPFLILHGQQDEFVPHNQGQLLHEALSGQRSRSSFISFPHAGHGTWQQMLEDDAVRQDASTTSTHDDHATSPRPCRPSWDTVISFLNEHLHAQPGEPEPS